ncbi:unnamed protein product [Ambrosiozyma monospora]|uniref:Unnamed protein product n=1 Tax=Ambrosiozyma monospora TaxID=43982 RepID=A0A9W7DJ90_AMBMO|nr:unnamed protein product [Ambrosiozyma monospora]
MMKAMCLLGQSNVQLLDIPRPKLLKDTDVVGKVLRATICGSDLHIIDGFFNDQSTSDEEEAKSKTAKTGSIGGKTGFALGHEGVIEITEVGSSVHNFKVGDVCVVSCISCCGECHYCKRNQQSHCARSEGSTPGVLGIEMNGLQSEYCRIPYADHSLYKCPKGIPLDVCLLLSDVLPTSYELGVRGRVQEGDTVAIVGMGPIGLGALLSLKPFKPSQIIAIDTNESRLKVAQSLGATTIINPQKQTNVAEIIHELTGNQGDEVKPGVDLAIECVGFPTTFDTCQDIIAPYGKIAVVGVPGKPFNLKMDELWISNFDLSAGLVSGNSIGELMEKIVSGSLDPSPLITHHFKLSEIEKAYDTFRRSVDTGAIKVSITPDGVEDH